VSVITVMKVPGDTAKFREFFATHQEQINAISARAKAAGCTSHVFGEGDGVIYTADRWESKEAFEKFFADPEIGQVMGDAGASGPPTLEFYEVIDDIDAW
jgi:heme-degrading monooxygenase HmoA